MKILEKEGKIKELYKCISSTPESPVRFEILYYGMSLWFGFNNVISFNRITHKEADGLFVLASNENLILGNLINHNGG